jgi:hypothetical protein
MTITGQSLLRITANQCRVCAHEGHKHQSRGVQVHDLLGHMEGKRRASAGPVQGM